MQKKTQMIDDLREQKKYRELKTEAQDQEPYKQKFRKYKKRRNNGNGNDRQ